jgi:hypothetical protein
MGALRMMAVNAIIKWNQCGDQKRPQKRLSLCDFDLHCGMDPERLSRLFATSLRSESIAILAVPFPVTPDWFRAMLYYFYIDSRQAYYGGKGLKWTD